MQPFFKKVSVNRNNMSENDLIKACVNGDANAMKTLYERNYSTMLGICRRYSPRKVDAEDLLHDGFVKIFKDIGSYKGRGSFEGWMKQVMINTVLSHLRKAKKENTVELFDFYGEENREEEEKTDTESELILNTDFSKEELIEIMRTLPPGYQQVLNLHVIDGFQHNEIAEMLNISVGTSKSQLNRGRKLMKHKLAEIAARRSKLLKVNDED